MMPNHCRARPTTAGFRSVASTLLTAGVFGFGASGAMAADCSSLASANMPFTTITAVQLVTSGSFTPPGSKTTYTSLPSFCRVAMVIAPSSDSDIVTEVWLPTTWNGRLLGTGNGGFAGSITYNVLASAIQGGYVGANTDMGTSPGAVQISGHPEKYLDYFPRSTHYMTVNAKILAHLLYGNEPSYSYFNGCSTGGAQGVAEAQIYPNDYDGILAGTPGYNRTHIIGALDFIFQKINTPPTSVISSAKLNLMLNAALAACPAAKALPTDTFFTDPTKCDFDPKVLACTGSDTSSCLTPPEVASAELTYQGFIHPVNGQRIFAGWPRGSEGNWGAVQSTHRAAPSTLEWAYGPSVNPLTVDWNTAMDIIDDTSAVAINPASSDLSRFSARGAKLLSYYGMADGLGHYSDGVNYFYRLASERGLPRSAVDNFARLFLVPNGGHCPTNFDGMSPLVNWVEKGVAPNSITATYTLQGKPATRPLCPYPQQAKYSGTGDPNAASSFVCTAEPEAPIELSSPQYTQALAIEATATAPTVDLRKDGLFSVALDSTFGPQSFVEWSPSNVKAEEADAVSTTMSADGKILTATFRSSDIAAFTDGRGAGKPVDVTISGFVTKDGILSLFAASAPVQLQRTLGCTDLQAAKAAVGAHRSDANYRADYDLDDNAVIDIRDVAAISKLVPAGTVCK